MRCQTTVWPTGRVSASSSSSGSLSILSDSRPPLLASSAASCRAATVGRDHAGPMRQHHFQRRGAVQRLGGNIHIGQQPGLVVDDDLLEAGILDQRQLCRRLHEIVEKGHGRTGVGCMRFTGNMRELDRHCHLLHHVGCMSPKRLDNDMHKQSGRAKAHPRSVHQLRLPEGGRSPPFGLIVRAQSDQGIRPRTTAPVNTNARAKTR